MEKRAENQTVKRDSMVLYRSFYEALRPAPPEIQAEACMAVFAYAMDGIEPELEGPAKAAFEMMRPQVRRDGKQEKRERGSIGFIGRLIQLIGR